MHIFLFVERYSWTSFHLDTFVFPRILVISICFLKYTCISLRGSFKDTYYYICYREDTFSLVWRYFQQRLELLVVHRSFKPRPFSLTKFFAPKLFSLIGNSISLSRAPFFPQDICIGSFSPNSFFSLPFPPFPSLSDQFCLGSLPLYCFVLQFSVLVVSVVVIRVKRNPTAVNTLLKVVCFDSLSVVETSVDIFSL